MNQRPVVPGKERELRHKFNKIEYNILSAKRSAAEAQAVLTWGGDMPELPYETTKFIMDAIHDLELVAERCSDASHVAELRAAYGRAKSLFPSVNGQAKEETP